MFVAKRKMPRVKKHKKNSNSNNNASNNSLLDPTHVDAQRINRWLPLPMLLDFVQCYDRNDYAKCYDASSSSMLQSMVLSVGVLMLALLYALKCYKRQQQQRYPTKKRRKLERQVSFTSSMIAGKVLPDHVDFPDSVINIYMEFAEGKCPSDEDLVTLIREKLLAYERLRQLPVVDKNSGRLSFLPLPSLDAQQLVRRITLETTKGGMYETIQQHLHDPLDDIHGRGALPWWEILVIEVCLFVCFEVESSRVEVLYIGEHCR